MKNIVSIKDEFARRENGHRAPRHNVNFVIFNEEGKVLVFYRFDKKSLAASGQSDPFHPNVEKWHDLPGGKIDYPEDNIDAILRESIEELGIYVTASMHLQVMDNPTPNCAPGSTRHIYVVTEYAGQPYNKAGLEEGHLALEAMDPVEAAMVLGDKVDFETKDFLCLMASDFFKKFCRPNKTEQVQLSFNPIG